MSTDGSVNSRCSTLVYNKRFGLMQSVCPRQITGSGGVVNIDKKEKTPYNLIKLNCPGIVLHLK